MAPTKPLTTVPKPRRLTPEMRAMLDKQMQEDLRALAKAEVESELLAEAKLAFIEEAKNDAKRIVDPNEELVSVRIDLPSIAPYICIDGRTYYYPNQVYEVPRRVFETLQDMMFRAWWSEEQRRGERDENAYRRSLNTKIGTHGQSLNV